MERKKEIKGKTRKTYKKPLLTRHTRLSDVTASMDSQPELGCSRCLF